MIKFLKDKLKYLQMFILTKEMIRLEMQKLDLLKESLNEKYDELNEYRKDFGLIREIAKDPEQRMKLLNAIMPILFVLPEQPNLDEMTKEQRQEFKQQAKVITELPVFKWVVKEMQNLAEANLFEKAMGENDLVAGKTMLYTIDVLKQKIENLSK